MSAASSTQRRDALHISSALYPFEGKFLTLANGVKLHYLDEGPRDAEGAVVMVHGNPTWSFYYRDVVRTLRDTHRCIVPDHIGMGLSDKPSDDLYRYTLAQRVDDLDALIRSTIDTSLAGLDHAAIKRLTIMVESQKIDKLKSIAKLERSFVKDIVNGMLTEFINDYEKRTGKSF